MVDRNVEKSLQLLGMQVHGEQPVHAGGHQEICHQLRRDRDARLVFAVLARVAEKWNHRGDARRAGPSRRIDQDEQFHQILVGRRARRLDDENIAPAHVLVDFHERLSVRKRAHRGVAQRHTDVFGNVLGQLRVRRAGKESHICFAAKHGLIFPDRRPVLQLQKRKTR
jgi:hypothetical protein